MISMILYGLLLVLLVYIVLNLIIFGRHAFSQDAVDPRYYCIEKLNKPFPYSELCREQIMKEIMNYTDGLEK